MRARRTTRPRRRAASPTSEPSGNPRRTTWGPVDVKPVPQRWTNAWVNLTLSYAGSQLSPIAPTFRLNPAGEVVPFADPDHRVGARLLANVGVRVSRLFGGRASFDATVFNLFDTKYAQGGSVRHPYPQVGRSIVVGVISRFRPAQP